MLVSLQSGLLSRRRAPAAANYATWNPSDKDSDVTLSGGNLIATVSASRGGVRATQGKATGKWYWEITVGGTAMGVADIGVCRVTASLEFTFTDDATAAGYNDNGQKVSAATGAAYGSSWTTGDVIGVAVDIDTGAVWFSKNGTWQASGDPGAGTNAAYTGKSFATTYPVVYDSFGTTPSFTANFGATAFNYSVPSGFNSGWYT